MRFLHTADWQIGMRALQARGAASSVRAERLETVARIVGLANERAVDFVLVAGDQFEDRAPALAEIGAIVATLRSARMPVFVIPGNHDPARPDSPYTGAVWSGLAGSNVVTVMARGAYDVPGGVLLAAPCTEKYGSADPTAAFRDMRSHGDLVHVGLAHGTLQLPTVATSGDNDLAGQRGSFPIALDAASRAGLAYLALGHWHSYLEHRDGDALIAYSGTPEQTRFSDSACGTVSIVEIAGLRATPVVTNERVGGLRWLERSYELASDASVDAAIAGLRAVETPERTLVRASFGGLCGPAGLERLDAAAAEFGSAFVTYDERRSFTPRPESAAAWVERFPHGVGRTLVERILARAGGADEADRAVAMRALEVLLEVAR